MVCGTSAIVAVDTTVLSGTAVAAAANLRRGEAKRRHIFKVLRLGHGNVIARSNRVVQN